MAAHLLVEYTARDDAVDEVQQAARAFHEATLENEPHLVRHDAHRIDGTRTFVHVLAFEDALALREHRGREHTETFTEAIAEGLEGDLDVRRLRPIDGD